MTDKLEFVSAIITNKEGNVLLLKRKNTLKLDPGKYDLCSGHMKVTEQVPMLSMLRELKEETGITQEQIKRMDNLGNIQTPHKMFLDTVCHMYHIEIDLSIEQINKMIQEVEEPEMESAKYLKDVNELRTIQKYTDLMRTIYTEEIDKVLLELQETLNKRKEMKYDLCKNEER